MRTRLWLVRHGATEWSEDRRLTGWTDVPLSSAGREEAHALGRRLAGRTFDGIWTSDLARAVETARVAWGEATLDPRLRELDFRDLEGMRWEELDPVTRRALAGFEEDGPPGAEPVRALRERVHACLEAIGPGRHLIFTHGGVIRLLLRDRGCPRAVPPGSVTLVTWRS